MLFQQAARKVHTLERRACSHRGTCAHARMRELFLRCARTYITLFTTDKRASYSVLQSVALRVFKNDFIFVSWEAISGFEYSDSVLHTVTDILSQSSG